MYPRIVNKERKMNEVMEDLVKPVKLKPKNREYTSVVCILCGKSIHVTYKLCKHCYKQYHMYMHEPWFLELARLEKIQNKINDMEPYSISDAVLTEIDQPDAQVVKNPVGRPAIDWRIVESILKIYDEDIDHITRNNLKRKPISYRSIARLLGNKVSYLTIREYIRKYRKNK